MTENNKETYFSFRGLIAAALSGFLCYTLYQITQIIQLGESRYHDNLFAQSFIDSIRYSSTKGVDFVDSFYSKARTLIYVLLLSYGLKTILSLKHAFINDTNNTKYVSYLFLVEAAFLGFLIGFTPFTDFFKAALILGIPTLILYGLLDE